MTSAAKKFGRIVSFIALLSPLMLLLGISAAYAQTVQQGLTISPFLLERKMEKGQTSEEIIDITNTSGLPLPVLISISDFLPVGDSGQQVFLDPGQGDPRFSLSSWLKIESQPKPILAPHEKTSIRFSIAPPANATEGGHYGAILFTFQGSQPEGTAVAVTQKLGAIILVKLGKAVENGQISKFAADKSFYEYPPVNFSLRFKNTGNVHVQPRGGITITNMFGRRVGTALVNENGNNVLPETERLFQSVWKDNFAFGRYKAEARVVFGDSGQVDTATATFWVLPWKAALIVALLIFLAVLLLTAGVKRYNRWVLRQAYAQSVPPKRMPRRRSKRG